MYIQYLLYQELKIYMYFDMLLIFYFILYIFFYVTYHIQLEMVHLKNLIQVLYLQLQIHKLMV